MGGQGKTAVRTIGMAVAMAGFAALLASPVAAQGTAPITMKLSTANPLNECSTERHHNGGTELATGLYSSRTLGIAYGICSAPPTSDFSGACLSGGSHHAPIDVEAMV